MVLLDTPDPTMQKLSKSGEDPRRYGRALQLAQFLTDFPNSCTIGKPETSTVRAVGTDPLYCKDGLNRAYNGSRKQS